MKNEDEDEAQGGGVREAQETREAQEGPGTKLRNHDVEESNKGKGKDNGRDGSRYGVRRVKQMYAVETESLEIGMKGGAEAKPARGREGD